MQQLQWELTIVEWLLSVAVLDSKSGGGGGSASSTQQQQTTPDQCQVGIVM